MMFARNPDLDRNEIATALATSKRVQVTCFLEPAGAELLARYLEQATNWCHVLNAGDKVYEIACDALEAMSEPQRATLIRKADELAAHAFQFRFDTIRVPDGREERLGSKRPVDEFALFMSSPPMVRWFRAVTGCNDIDFADCQATRYRGGAYLTRHDDAVEEKRRHFAYVLSLSCDWRAEWGGLLIFPGDDAISIEAMVPRFNTLTLFEVGQPHSVSQVASYAPQPRLSVTGWLRSDG